MSDFGIVSLIKLRLRCIIETVMELIKNYIN